MTKCKTKKCYNESLDDSQFCADCQLEESDDFALRDEWGMEDDDFD